MVVYVSAVVDIENSMMEYEFRVIVEKVSVTSQKVVKRETVKIYDLKPPESILDLGLRHQEQISLLSKVQSALLAEQSKLIDSGYDACPKCGQKISKNGFLQSKFFAVFSDHKLPIQKHCCKNPDCNWQSGPTIKSVFGTDIHPDLAKLQCEQGALHSYREAATNLEKLNAQRRSINNHDRVKMMTNQLGAHITQENYKPPIVEELPVPAQELIVQVNSGHIPIKGKAKGSFEALSGVVYRPTHLEAGQQHRRITDKSCAISAMDDGLATIKTYLYHTALKQGLTEHTHVTGLADGASHCWSVILALEPFCHSLELILDWFHIAKKFQNVKNELAERFGESVETARWSLWHGKIDDSLQKLTLVRDNMSDEKKRSKLKGLQEYLENNRDYLVNYAARVKANKPFIGQVVESHIDTIINVRHKQKQKMQWTHQGAHNVLQIRALMTSNEWEEKWLEYVMPNRENLA